MQHLLVIDDTRTVIVALKQYFADHEYEVIAPECFLDATRLLKEHVVELNELVNKYAPAAVILDLNIPALAGEKVARFLRWFYKGPIIVYSGESAEARCDAAERVKAFAHISKDAPFEDLLDAIRRATS